MIDHLQRDSIVAEVHARPFLNLEAPLSVLHIAVLLDGMELEHVEEKVFSVMEQDGFAVDTEQHGYFFCRKGDQGIRYEPHSEFYTLTFYHYGNCTPQCLSSFWREELPGALLVGTQILMRDKTDDFYGWAAENFGKHQLTSASVTDNAALICTDFHQHTDGGFTRILIENNHLRLPQAGRLVQRLCEIETYRHTALLSLSVARELMPKITELDHQLASIAQRTGSGDPQELLTELMKLSGKVESLSAATANDFAAREAHFALVGLRIRELREVRVKGLQMVQEFMDRRLDPARRTCSSASNRIEQLSTRIARTTQLIRSQVDLAIEQQNRDLLEAMNKRSRSQLRLQAKLEGLSVVVLAYYLYDLFNKALQNVLPEGDLRSLILFSMTIALPVFILVLYFIVKRVLSGVFGDEIVSPDKLKKLEAKKKKKEESS